MSLSIYLTVSTKKTAFLIRCPDELLGEKGWNWLFPPEALGLILGFWKGGCVSESKPEPDSALGLLPPLHMAELTQLKAPMALCYTGSSKPRSGIFQPGIISAFPSFRTPVLLALCRLPVGFGERK